MNNLFKVKALASLAICVLATSSCSKEETSFDSQIRASDVVVITKSDMVGYWSLSGMTADTPVDLDANKVASENLLDETDCFNTMSITFEEDGTFVTNNSQMTFESGTSNNRFSCLSDRPDSGIWEISNNELVLTVEINSETYVHRKPIDLDSGIFSFEVTKIESNEYVNDPGDTQASPIRILELEYTKS